MNSVLTAIGLFATATVFGSMAFFSAIIAPLVFINLSADVAGAFIRKVFPWYYLVIVVLSGISSAALVFIRPLDAAIMASITLTGLVARQALMPQINQARDAVLAGNAELKTRFSRLHRLSVWINAAQLIAAGVVLARFV